ncbi:MAG TPA: glycosyltransferase family 2 protein [Phycisphaerae bacterium]|nr:glycosyltransferase family 2 protein [Phycisphaerae bacterium]HUU22755.1 glycosyltransferase family 2 protein [Phycisphaerae bacterium]
MPDRRVEVVVLIVCYNGRRHLDECLGSVLADEEAGIRTRVVVVDNASADGSADYVAERFPRVELVRSRANLGFAGGNNLGWEHIRRKWPDLDYLVLLNQDTLVEPGWLGPLAGFLAAHPDAACAQPKLMMHPQTDRFNTSGNRSHFLGFGFVGDCGEVDRGQLSGPREVAFTSGAAMMVRADLLRGGRLFEGAFFMYLEDAELCWRLGQSGHGSFVIPDSVVYHKYAYGGNLRHYYYLERNRWFLLGAYYKPATLALLAPAAAVMELGQLVFAIARGVGRQKWRSWAFFLTPAGLGLLLRRRRQARRRRAVSDRRFTRTFCGTIDFPPLSGPLVRLVANPVLGAYWAVARRLIFW